MGQTTDTLMGLYPLSLDEALDVPDCQAAVLLKYGLKRKFIEQENLATLIQIKIAQLFSKKKIDIPRPYDLDKKASKKTRRLTEGQLNKLVNLAG